jgi:hypothetical protein
MSWYRLLPSPAQEARRDFAQAIANFFVGIHGRPSWRKAGHAVTARPRSRVPERVNREHQLALLPA